MSADKRSVSTDALETLGTIIGEGEKRDAIHLAVLPVMAGARLKPGQAIAVTDGVAVPEPGGILIVDPFLREPAMPGERFWAVVRPRLITSLRHVWTHPDFPSDEVTAPQASASDFDLEKAKARAVIESIAEQCNVDSADELIWGAESYLKHGDYMCEGGRWEGVCLPDEFWPAFETLTGRKVKEDDRGSFFSCSC